MAGIIQTKSRTDRVVILLSAVWCVASLILALFIMEEEHLEAHEFLFLLLIFLSPVILYWSVRWVRGGEKTQKAEEKDNAYTELVSKEPSLITTTTTYGLGKKLHAMAFFGLLMLAGFAADFFINLHMIDKAYEYGWGNIPQSLISDVEQWSNYSMILRAASGIAFLIVVAMSYTDIKVQLEGSGVKGIKCSVGMLFVWLIIPFANIVMPWRAFGALDRAAKYAAKFKRGGELWNQKGHRGVSFRSISMGVLFVVMGGSATIYNKELASLANRTPDTIYAFGRIINKNNDLLIFMAVVYAAFMLSVWVYFFYLNKNVKRVGSS